MIKARKVKRINKEEENTMVKVHKTPLSMSKSKPKGVATEVKKKIPQMEEKISIGLEYNIPEGEEFVAIVKGFSRNDTGILMHLTIFAEEICNKTFYYKDNTSAISQLRKFASLFEAFDGELSSVVGECVVIIVSSTEYGFQFARGVRSVTEKEANNIIAKSGYNYEDDVNLDINNKGKKEEVSISEEEEEFQEKDFEEEEEELDYDDEDEEEEEEEDY